MRSHPLSRPVRFAAALSLLLLPGIAPGAGIVRVSPDGPLRSLSDALAQVAARRADLQETPVIEIAAGRYELDAPVRIGPEHTESAAAPGLIIRGAGAEVTILSGGQLIAGWEPDPAREGRWRAHVPEGALRNITQLHLNGERLTRARTPNAGEYFHAAGEPGTGSPIAIPVRPEDVAAAKADSPGAWLVMLMKWTDLHVPVQRYDAENGVLLVPGGPRPPWMNEPDARYWIENVPEAADAPGEWYLNRSTGELLAVPPAGTDMRTARVVAPGLAELFRVEGSPDRPVRGLRVEKLTFSDSDHPLPPDGLISPQAAVPVRGAFRATHAVDGVIAGCAFRCITGYAIDLGRGTQRWRVTGNSVTGIGAGGIRIGEPGDREPSAADACHSHHITDNRLHELGRVFPPACGILILQSGENRIAHNHIRDLYYTGISVGWTWGYRVSPCRGNLVEFNLVEQVGQGMLSDMGGIYTLGPQPGTIIRNNVFRDVTGYRYGGWGLYTDEGSTGILLENNVAVHCSDAGFHQHYGRDNIVRNNLLAWNRNHSVMRTRVEEHLSFEFTGNVIIANSGTLLGSSWDGTTEQFRSDRNVWFDTRPGADPAAYRFAGAGWQEWQARGQDVHSVIADPLLVDPDRPEAGLRPESPAFALGFRPIDLSRLGPRPPEERDDAP